MGFAPIASLKACISGVTDPNETFRTGLIDVLEM